MGEKKNRYSIVYYNGFVIDCISLLVMVYFPMQNVYLPTQMIFMLHKVLYINM